MLKKQQKRPSDGDNKVTIYGKVLATAIESGKKFVGKYCHCCCSCYCGHIDTTNATASRNITAAIATTIATVSPLLPALPLLAIASSITAA